MHVPSGEITPTELAARQRDGTAPTVIDVREQHEYDFCRIEGAQLKPLGQIATWARELDPQQEYVFVCHSGQRSAYTCMLLAQAGFQDVKNLVGGVDHWAVEVDPTMPRY